MTTTKVSYAGTGNNMEERLAKTNRMLVWLFVFIVAFPLLIGLIRNAKLSIIKDIEITNLTTMSNTLLCPGEKLTYSYDLKTRGEGVLLLDSTVWNVEPPKTIVYSEERRFIMGEPLDQKSVESWVVPSFFFNYSTYEMEPMPPGDYIRYITISSPTLSTATDTEPIHFTIKEGCLQ